jgi:hypothetical protein
MPFTPLHFGPGLIVKTAAPTRFSLTAFIVANVAIDVEPLYHIIQGDYPVHGPLHTLLGATTTGLLAGVSVFLLSQLSRRVPFLQNTTGKLPTFVQAEFILSACILGGVIGGISHSLIDALIYSDVHPFAPMSLQNPFLGSVRPDALTNSLVLAGAVGFALLIFVALFLRRAR